ncbi:MAG: gamma-glutamylcyclotransferase, partial [Armatimonadota bacterium]
ERYCKGACSIEHVSIPGKLYALPSGIPVLQVPDECILARGTNDPMADVATQERFEPDEYMRPDDIGDWVHGELMTFDDPETRLPLIDRLEGYCPGVQSLYRRVLVYVYSGAEAIPAWCYVLGEHPIQGLSLTGKASWP